MGEVVVHSERKGVSLGWTPEDEEADEVTVYATGEQGDVHNKLPQPNNGEAGVFYPADFVGESTVEVRDADGNVLHGPTTFSVA